MTLNNQATEWMGKFGNEYTKRSVNPDGNGFEYCFEMTREELNGEFIGSLKKDIKILEVGVGTGRQLTILKKMGFQNLCGIELNREAISLANKQGIFILPGNACDTPFKDNLFDLVFTSALLIHIPPSDIEKALKEIYRCSRRYIWGYEYYAPEYTEIVYRGKKNMLWKADFLKMYLDLFPNLKLVKKKNLKYINIPSYWEKGEYRDMMFLLEKG